MNALTLLTIVALFFLFALAWHDQSARDEGKAGRADGIPEIKIRHCAKIVPALVGRNVEK